MNFGWPGHGSYLPTAGWTRHCCFFWQASTTVCSSEYCEHTTQRKIIVYNPTHDRTYAPVRVLSDFYWDESFRPVKVLGKREFRCPSSVALNLTWPKVFLPRKPDNRSARAPYDNVRRHTFRYRFTDIGISIGRLLQRTVSRRSARRLMRKRINTDFGITTYHRKRRIRI